MHAAAESQMREGESEREHDAVLRYCVRFTAVLHQDLRSPPVSSNGDLVAQAMGIPDSWTLMLEDNVRLHAANPAEQAREVASSPHYHLSSLPSGL
ncbi:hypothetical protein G7Y89_g13073 [Cudoniella acicularis]|uniref:Uncharacterized protein n=1 Tax=Cudoniella acicularis TaxID=354080 RepID=A0A8H4R823_9HELO|nr:hypothetical protein G7Y89_g13073 [Cudoniella acicularis]